MTQFNQFIPHINTGLLKELCLHENKQVLFHKKTYFLQEGEVSTHIGYVESGIFKYTTYNRSEGREYNVGIVFPGEFIADYPSCLYGMASEVNIQALTPCRVYLCPTDRLNMKQTWSTSKWGVLSWSNCSLTYLPAISTCFA